MIQGINIPLICLGVALALLGGMTLCCIALVFQVARLKDRIGVMEMKERIEEQKSVAVPFNRLVPVELAEAANRN